MDCTRSRFHFRYLGIVRAISGYEINHGEGSENVFVDQRQPHLKGELWCSLGSFPFQKGEQYFVELFNENTKGYVVVDALQILAS